MASDPHNPLEPFNRLVDVADVRGFKVGLRTGEALVQGHGNDQWRALVAIECKTKEKILLEPIHRRGLQAAAQALLTRLPAKV